MTKFLTNKHFIKIFQSPNYFLIGLFQGEDNAILDLKRSPTAMAVVPYNDPTSLQNFCLGAS